MRVTAARGMTPPELLGELTSGDRPITQKDWEAYNEAAWQVSQDQLDPCPNCGRQTM